MASLEHQQPEEGRGGVDGVEALAEHKDAQQPAGPVQRGAVDDAVALDAQPLERVGGEVREVEEEVGGDKDGWEGMLVVDDR